MSTTEKNGLFYFEKCKEINIINSYFKINKNIYLFKLINSLIYLFNCTFFEKEFQLIIFFGNIFFFNNLSFSSTYNLTFYKSDICMNNNFYFTNQNKKKNYLIIIFFLVFFCLLIFIFGFLYFNNYFLTLTLREEINLSLILEKDFG